MLMGKKKEVDGVISPRKKFQSALKSWNDARLSCHHFARSIVDLRNESTYSVTEKVDSGVGVYMRPSNLFIDVSERMYSALSQLESKQVLMIEGVEEMSIVLSEYEIGVVEKEDDIKNIAEIAYKEIQNFSERPDFIVDQNFLKNLLHSITEQTILERHLCASLRPPSDTYTVDLAIDHDVAVTLLACFTHAPSLDESSLHLALEM